jgi:Protein of unknown function (DUF2971)
MLHRYFSSHAAETIRSKLLRVSLITSFNDPFEFLYYPEVNLTIGNTKTFLKRQMLKSDEFYRTCQQRFPHIKNKKDFKKFVAENRDLLTEELREGYQNIAPLSLEDRERMVNTSLRVICFSNSDLNRFDEILVWSHYADSHKGVRLGFEFPATALPFTLTPVVYRENRVKIDFGKTIGVTSPQKLMDALLEALKVKSVAWKYEQEFRIIIRLDDCVPIQNEAGDTDYYMRFDPSWLKTVDFGARCLPEVKNEMISILKQNYPHVVTSSAACHATEYALRYVRDERSLPLNP